MENDNIVQYNKLTRTQLEDAASEVFKQSNLGKGLYEQLNQRNIWIYDPSRISNVLMNEFIWDIKLPYKFKTKSGKIIEVEWDKYQTLKQETKDKLEPYRINGNI